MRLYRLLLCLVVLPVLSAQPPAARPARLPEPQIHADRTVTFRFAAVSATKVTLALGGAAAPLPMQRLDHGLWTVTTPVLAPEYYSYHFNVDGSPVLDPDNVLVEASLLATGNGLLVPGSPAEPWEMQAMPHGAVHHHVYTSKVVQGLEAGQSEYFVYTPPGYDPRDKTRYPVLYLLHGWSHLASGWTEEGKANDVLDALIAAGKARPMIVVMPLGYGDMSFVRHGFNVWGDQEAIEKNTRLFSTALLDEVVPAVERDYNVSLRREDHAIAGLSMGGLEALTIGLLHPERFAYVAGFSSAVHRVDPNQFAAVDPKKANLKLLWIACGTEDDLLAPNRTLAAGLKTAGFPVTAVETPGRHTWMVWRDNLTHFVPLLFQGQ